MDENGTHFQTHRDLLAARRVNARDTVNPKLNLADAIPAIRASGVADETATVSLNSKYPGEHVLAAIASQYLRGQKTSAIAQNIGISATDVSDCLRILRERWKASSLQDFSQRRADELAKLEELEATYWHAWEESQKNAVQQTRTDGFDQQGGRRPARHVTKQLSSTGDVRFLDGVWKCIERRIKLLGLDAEQRHIVAATVTTENTNHDLAARMERYAGVFGFSVIARADETRTAADDGDAEPVDTARSPSPTGGLSDIIDAEFHEHA